METVNIDQLADKLTQVVKEYTDDVSKAIEKEIDSSAKLILNQVKAKAPKDTGNYANGFQSTKQTREGHRVRVIWNKKVPTLVHLLEFGHAKVGGGRVAARPHLRPAYDEFEGSFVDRIKQIVRNGG